MPIMGGHAQRKGLGTMPRNNSRSVLAALVSGWLITAGSSCGVAAGQPPALSGAVLAQARPTVPPPPDVEASIASLRQRLQLTPAQEAPFNAVASAASAAEGSEGGLRPDSGLLRRVMRFIA